jgi:hypothetical protein
LYQRLLELNIALPTWLTPAFMAAKETPLPAMIERVPRSQGKITRLPPICSPSISRMAFSQPLLRDFSRSVLAMAIGRLIWTDRGRRGDWQSGINVKVTQESRTKDRLPKDKGRRGVGIYINRPFLLFFSCSLTGTASPKDTRSSHRSLLWDGADGWLRAFVWWRSLDKKSPLISHMLAFTTCRCWLAERFHVVAFP